MRALGIVIGIVVAALIAALAFVFASGSSVQAPAPAAAAAPPPPPPPPPPVGCMVNGNKAYLCNFGYAYGKRDEWYNQCGKWSGGGPETPVPVVVDGIAGNNPCKLARGAPVYFACGKLYMSEKEAIGKCGSAGKVYKWVGDGLS